MPKHIIYIFFQNIYNSKVESEIHPDKANNIWNQESGIHIEYIAFRYLKWVYPCVMKTG